MVKIANIIPMMFNNCRVSHPSLMYTLLYAKLSKGKCQIWMFCTRVSLLHQRIRITTRKLYCSSISWFSIISTDCWKVSKLQLFSTVVPVHSGLVEPDQEWFVQNPSMYDWLQDNIKMLKNTHRKQLEKFANYLPW